MCQVQEDKATQVFPLQNHGTTQVCQKYRSKQVQTSIKCNNRKTSPFKFTVSTAASPFKISVERTVQPPVSQSTVSRRLFVIEEKYDSNTSCTPSITGSTVEHEYSQYTLSSPSKITSDTCSQEEYQKLNLPNTIAKIKKKPKLYIGLPKELYFLIKKSH